MICYLGMYWFCLVKCMLNCSQRLVWLFINLDFCSESALGGFGCLELFLKEARFPSKMKGSQGCVTQNKEVWGRGGGRCIFSLTWPTSSTVTCTPRGVSVL